MNKTLFVIAGIALLAVPSLQAQGRGRGAGAGPRGGSLGGMPTAINRGATFNRGSSFNSGSNLGRGATLNRGSSFNGSRYRGGYYGHGGNRGRGGHYGHGRYYYLGGVPYYYPFFDYGFGYPYYGSGFGYGFSAYDYAGPGPGYYDTPYNGTIVEETAPENLRASGPSLQTAIQRQLAKRGYYKGTIDGDFGPGSRDALKRFQADNRVKQTGRIDEATLKALGFTDRR